MSRDAACTSCGKFVFLGSWYDVELCDTPLEVDKEKRKSLFGQIDTWMKICRLYHGPRDVNEVKKDFIHEVFHLCEDFINSEDFAPPENFVIQFADLMFDTLQRNRLLVEDWSHVLGVK